MPRTKQDATAAQLYARLQPANPAGGYTVTRCLHGGKTWIGGRDPQWQPITAAQADALRQIPQDPLRAGSPPRFQIATGAEIQQLLELDQARTLQALGQRMGVDPALLTGGPRRLPFAQPAAPAAPAAAPAQPAPRAVAGPYQDLTQVPPPAAMTGAELPPGVGDVTTQVVPGRRSRRAAAIPGPGVSGA